MNSRLFYIIVAIIFFAGIAIALLRSHYLDIPLVLNDKQKIWLVEARIDFHVPKQSAVRIDLALPKNPVGFEMLEEQSISAGYGFNIEQKNNHKRGIWTKNEALGQQTLYYKLKLKPIKWEKQLQKPTKEESGNRIYFTNSYALAAKDIIKEVTKVSSDEKSFTQELIKKINQNNNQNVSMLLSNLQKHEVLHRLLSMANISNIISHGLTLEDSRRNQSLNAYLEVYTKDEGWLLFDTTKGLIHENEHLLLWSQGASSLIDVVGGKDSRINFSMVEQNYFSVQLAKEFPRSSFFNLFSVNTLPVEEQGMFKMMLLMPMGVLIVVFMRIFIGIKTSGTFMPVLIAIAFLQTSFIVGIISFISIVFLGLLIRTYLSFLNLLMVARISAIIIIVIFLIGFLSIIGYNLGLNTGMTVTFFPIIIIAWTIERMSILWEEEGSKEVLIQGGGSLLVASMAYTFMQFTLLEHITFNFPEINLCIIALILLLGRYSGYRVLELYRFRQWRA